MAIKKNGSLTGWCRQDEFILFFLPTFALVGQLGNGNSNPTQIAHIVKAPQADATTKALTKSAILPTHLVNI